MNIEKKLYQWDTEQKLTGCTGLYVDFPIGNEVYRVETADGTCIIPDELLQTSGSHKVYECMTNNTIRSFAFSVTPRPKPPDYVYTPTERLTFEGLVQRVDDAVADMIRRAESGEFDGHTPVKGTDYFTTGEIQRIQNEVSSGAIGEFKSVVDTETETFNTNAESKLTTYNENDVAKTGAYNTNASNKVTEYNSNAENKTAEFDTHTEQIQADISELKSDLVNSNLIAQVDFNDVTDGKYINKNGVIDTSYNYSYTKPVQVKKGHTVVMRGAGVDGYISMIAEFLGGTAYKSLITDNGNTVQDYVYTVPRDMQLTFSYNRTMEHSCKIYYDVSNNDTNIEAKFSAIGMSKNIDFTNAVQGSFVGSNGLIQPSGGFAYLNNIPVSKGDTVTFVARGYNTGVAMIAMVNGNNEFTPLVKSVDSTIRTYEYSFKKSCVICLSYNNNYDHSCTIVKNLDKIGGNYETLFGHGVLFPRMAVIGDSLSSGELVINGQAEDVYSNSWLSFLARKTNASARTHYSQGGLTARGWLNTYLTKMQSDTPFNAYFVALGTNDCFSHPYDIGTVSDESGSDTFVGYYKQIIDSVRTKAPNCVIFCVSTYNNVEAHIPYNQMIKDIADLYDNCFFVDFVGNTQIYTSTGSVWSDTGHFTTIGYNYVASVIYQLVNDIVDNNPQFFKWFGKYNSVGEKYND